MNAIDIFPWDDNFKTGLPKVDEQHRKLVELLNQLASHVAFGSDDFQLNIVFEELVAYTVYHFQTEEATWHQYLPGHAQEVEHQDAHSAFLATVQRLIEEQDRKSTTTGAEDTLDFLVRWLISHILEVDRQMAYVVLAMQAGMTFDVAQADATARMSGTARAMIDIILSIYGTLSRNTLRLMRELSERKQAEDKLRASEARLHALFDGTQDGILVADIESRRFVDANPAICTMLGYERDELVGLGLADIHPQADVPHVVDTFERLVRGELPVAQNIPVLRRDRSVLSADIGLAIFTFDGQRYAAGFFRDTTEQRRAAQKLKNTEELLRATLEHSPNVAVQWYDRSGRVTYWNHASERLYGWMAHEVLGKTLDQLIQIPEEAAAFRDSLQRVAEIGAQIGPEEHHTHHRSGATRWVLSTLFAIPGNADHEPIFVGMDVDITERKRAEKALLEGELMSRQLYNSMPDPVFVVTPDGERFLDVNHAASELLGYSREELLQVGPAFIDAPIDKEKLPERFRQLRETRHIVHEAVHICKNGHQIPVELHSHLIKQDGQSVILGVARNLTERKRLQEELQRERDFAESLIETAQVIILVLDTKGRIVRFNPYMERLSGYRLGDMQGKDWFDSFLPEHDREHVRSFFDVAASAMPTSGNINPIVTSSGEERQIEWYNTPLKDDKEGVIALLCIGQDITERKRAAEELKALNATLEQRVREEVASNRDKDLLLTHQSRLAAMGEMVHNIAHQWRQPLNALTIVISNIKDDYDFGELTTEKLQQAVRKSHQLVERMSATIEDFRDFFRPDKIASDFFLDSAVKDAVFIFGDSLKNANIELVKDLEKELIAHGYHNQFAQCMLNLLANAKDALQQRQIASGRIEIRLRRAGYEGIVTVQDNAGGIDEAVLPKIFDSYFTTKDQGSGIGLYMTRLIIERNMNGKIEVTNRNNGALFTVAIPLVKEISG